MNRRLKWIGACARRSFAGGLLLGLYLFVLALTCSGPLHEWLHADACNPDHDCVVTQLNSGHVLMPVADGAPLPVLSVRVAEPPTVLPVPFASRFLLPNRGPPSSLIFVTVAG